MVSILMKIYYSFTADSHSKRILIISENMETLWSEARRNHFRWQMVPFFLRHPVAMASEAIYIWGVGPFSSEKRREKLGYGPTLYTVAHISLCRGKFLHNINRPTNESIGIWESALEPAWGGRGGLQP